MSILEIVNSIIITVGIPVVIGAFIYIGRKLQILEDLDEILKHEIKPNLSDTKDRLLVVETELRQVWKEIKQH
jgi:ACR3 family arsenite efflux pump ArsB